MWRETRYGAWYAERVVLPLALSVTAAMSPAPVLSGDCNPTRVHFAGRITSTAPGTVTYTWVRPNYPASRTFTLQFTQPGTLPVSYDLLLRKAERGWVLLRVVLPEKAESAKVLYQVTCGK
jgi:hypothetical protein